MSEPNPVLEPPAGSPAGAPRLRKRRGWAPFALVGFGLVITAFSGGLVLGAFVPSSAAVQPTPIVVTVVPNDRQGETITVPDVRGLSEEDARQVLADAGIDASKILVAKVPYLMQPGYVAAQDPVAGTTNPSTVTLSLPVAATVPDLTGKTEDQARQALAAMGATTSVARTYASGKTPGEVLSTDPAAGSPLTGQVQVTVAATPATKYLSKIADQGPCRPNSAAVDGNSFPESVSCDAYAQPATTFWLINRKTASLSAIVGIDDRTDPAAKVRITILGDGKTLYSVDVGYGTSAKLDVATSGVLRLEVIVQRLDAGKNSSIAVLGDAIVTGSIDDLNNLAAS